MKVRMLAFRNLGTFACMAALLVGMFTLPSCSGIGTAAGGGGGGGGGGTGNSVAISVNAGPANNSLNMPFVSVQICVPGSSNCQTISNVLVDTGSTGLRILSTQVTIPLLAATSSTGNPLGECVMFADGSFLWGSVSAADVSMAGEKASAVPIQIVRTTGSVGFPTVPLTCSANGVDHGTSSTLGANGILGVGLFTQDCGTACTVSPPANVYYDAGAACVPTSCSLVSVPLLSQVSNPVAGFTKDNNGVLISMSSVTGTGAATATGSLIFGIGTQSNNALGTAKIYTTDSFGFFTATYNNISYPQSFVDSGSNAFFFLDSTTTSLPACTTLLSFYCPASSTSFTVTNTGNSGTSQPVTFSVASAEALLTANPSFTAIGNIAGPFPGAFDYGFPFFYGRPVFTAISGATTPSGTGPYFAY